MSAPVFVVDDRHDVLELNRILLEAEGYETEGYSYAELMPERLQQDPPDVMLLDLVPGNQAPWDLLRRLRHDPLTKGIGVVVTSDSPALVDRATRDTSLGVAAGLVMPFNIESLYQAIATAAQHGPTFAPPDTPAPLLGRAAAVLRQARRRVLLQWVQRLSLLDAFRRHPDLSLPEMEGRGEGLFDGIVEALQLGTSLHDGAVLGATLDAARAHARLRRTQGMGQADLAREMAALRHEVWHELRTATAGDEVTCDGLWDLLHHLNVGLDALLSALLEAWDEAVQS